MSNIKFNLRYNLRLHRLDILFPTSHPYDIGLAGICQSIRVFKMGQIKKYLFWFCLILATIIWDYPNMKANKEVIKKMNKPFKITYYAKKHGKHITRTGTHDEKCRFWKSAKGVNLYTYFDLDEWGYRTASTTWKVRY